MYTFHLTRLCVLEDVLSAVLHIAIHNYTNTDIVSATVTLYIYISCVHCVFQGILNSAAQAGGLLLVYIGGLTLDNTDAHTDINRAIFILNIILVGCLGLASVLFLFGVKRT